MKGLGAEFPLTRMTADLLILGGGTAGLMAAITARRLAPACRVVVLEKAHVERSGCLAAGVNALNAYLPPGEDPQGFVEWVREDNAGLVREDLVRSIAERLPTIPPLLEEWGLPIPHAPGGGYVFRGPRSIVIQGERLKPLLAEVARESGAVILNRVVVTGYLAAHDRIAGACGFGLRDGVFLAVEAGAVICAMGGAGGLYPPPNGGPARHRTWYSPFNCGTGYAMGLRAGAELTSLEMRFVPLRVKDVQAPTGTVAQGVKARQVNALGTEYLRLGGKPTTAGRLSRTLREERKGRGPCYLELGQLTVDEEAALLEAYLAMCPAMALYWADRGGDPRAARLEIAGAEPCLVGGHAQAGYWVDVDRQTTLPGLLAAGDAAGGAPKKYVPGCLAEGEIAAETAVGLLSVGRTGPGELDDQIAEEYRRVMAPLRNPGAVRNWALEARLQKIMEEYAGGTGRGYATSEARLRVAADLLREARGLAEELGATDLHDLMSSHEVVDRLDVALAAVEHLRHRRETRWPVYQNRADFPHRDDGRWKCFVNSRREADGALAILERWEGPDGGWAPWH